MWFSVWNQKRYAAHPQVSTLESLQSQAREMIPNLHDENFAQTPTLHYFGLPAIFKSDLI